MLHIAMWLAGAPALLHTRLQHTHPAMTVHVCVTAPLLLCTGSSRARAGHHLHTPLHQPTPHPVLYLGTLRLLSYKNNMTHKHQAEQIYSGARNKAHVFTSLNTAWGHVHNGGSSCTGRAAPTALSPCTNVTRPTTERGACAALPRAGGAGPGVPLPPPPTVAGGDAAGPATTALHAHINKCMGTAKATTRFPLSWLRRPFHSWMCGL